VHQAVVAELVLRDQKLIDALDWIVDRRGFALVEEFLDRMDFLQHCVERGGKVNYLLGQSDLGTLLLD